VLLRGAGTYPLEVGEARWDYLGVSGPVPAWSAAVEEADWIGERLSPFDVHIVTSVVPAGFDAYARVLHPAQEPGRDGDRLVRWTEVAAWSGMPLRREAQFHSIALPPVRPQADAPWSGQGPEEGSLYLPDAEVLAGLAREWTATPGQCWFCLWDGYDWTGSLLARPGEPAVRVPDPIPAAFRNGPRAGLPNRDYLVYAGPVEAVTAVAPLSGLGQTPNLWWPADRAWCVATEIDLPWTYVGGPADLIERILGDERIEALAAEPGDSLTHIEEWVTRWVDDATATLLADGEAFIATSRGTVQAWLDLPSWLGRGMLRTRTAGDNGVSGTSQVGLSRSARADLRDDISFYLTSAITGLVG
jgi:hypothetical protein